ncbi:MAG: crossover junction endodeoxyribonuclease RuvC [Planctomycetota bacterium]|nr:crossover junction endodeoxyribonuclease RuvC [Planctomycetota bacterium]
MPPPQGSRKPPSAGAPRLLIGIDPGTQKAGWGIVEARGLALRLVACGVLQTPARAEMSVRLRAIFEELEAILARHRPEAAGLEETFAGNNPKSAIAMGQGRGVALLALARAGVPVTSLAPNEIKKAVTANGLAGKDLVAKMVCARLGLAAPPEPSDVTDALAAAIALAQRLPQ